MENRNIYKREKLTFQEYFSYIRSYSFKITIAFIIIMALVAVVLVLDLGGLSTLVKSYTGKLMESLEGLVNDDGSIDTLGLILNNIRVTFLAFFIGIVPFIYLPAFVLAINAGIVGGLLGVIGSESILGTLSIFVFGILPHGILELPAIFFAVAAGMILCSAVSKKMRKKEADLSVKEAFLNGLKTIIFVCIPLMIVAGLIETKLTPLLLNLAM